MHGGAYRGAYEEYREEHTEEHMRNIGRIIQRSGTCWDSLCIIIIL